MPIRMRHDHGVIFHFPVPRDDEGLIFQQGAREKRCEKTILYLVYKWYNTPNKGWMNATTFYQNHKNPLTDQKKPSPGISKQVELSPKLDSNPPHFDVILWHHPRPQCKSRIGKLIQNCQTSLSKNFDPSKHYGYVE